MSARGSVTSAAFFLLTLVMILAACGGDDDDSTGSTCSAYLPPPAEGVGPDDLQGTITYVRLIAGCEPDIYVMDATGDNARAVYEAPTYDDEGDLSPDGSKVVFFSKLTENASVIYTINVDGSDLKQLTADADALAVSPRWSPDGTKIAYSDGGNIVIMNADGSDKKTVFEALPGSTNEPCRVSATVGGWAPDGQKITYYSSIIRAGDNRFWVCALDLASLEIEVLVETPLGGLHAEPHWSPDGTKIAFRDDRGTIEECNLRAGGDCDYEIYVLDLETGMETNISNNPAYDIEPVWSPDGQWILFSSTRDDPNFDLYIMRPDGSEVQRILSDPASKDSYPSWR